jgi:hypothetical protein
MKGGRQGRRGRRETRVREGGVQSGSIEFFVFGNSLGDLEGSQTQASQIVSGSQGAVSSSADELHRAGRTGHIATSTIETR